MSDSPSPFIQLGRLRRSEFQELGALELVGLAPKEYHAEGILHEGRSRRRVSVRMIEARNAWTVFLPGESQPHIQLQKDPSLSVHDMMEGLQHALRFHPADELRFWMLARDLPRVRCTLAHADPNVVNLDGLLPLDSVNLALSARGDLLKWHLERQGAVKPDLETKLSDHLRQIATMHEIRQLLLEAGAIDQAPFRDAVRHGDWPTADRLLAEGGMLDARTLNRVPLLIERMLHKDEAAVRWLLAKGADSRWRFDRFPNVMPTMIVKATPELRDRFSSHLVLTPATAAIVADWPLGLQLLRSHDPGIKLTRVLSDWGDGELLPAWVGAAY